MGVGVGLANFNPRAVEEAARVRVRLLQELASTREALVATHLPCPSVCHVAVDGTVSRRTGRLGLLTAC